MTNRQPPWNIHEAVILLDAFFAITDGLVSRNDAVKKVSLDLRKMALSQGLEINQTFRNENGISLQIHNMKSVFYKQSQGVHASKLFADVVRIYRENRGEYQKLLKEAKIMIENYKTTDENFMQYLSEKVPPSKFSELCAYYSDIDAFCQRIGILKKPLLETTDFEIIKKVQRTIEQNKIFRVTRKKQHAKIVAACRYYYIYVRERQSGITDTVHVLEKKLRNGSQQDDTLSTDDVCVNPDTAIKAAPMIDSSAATPLFEKKLQNSLHEAAKSIEKSTEQNIETLSPVNLNRISTAAQAPIKENLHPKQQLKESDRAIQQDMEQLVLQADIDGMSYDDLKDALQITMVLTKKLVAHSTRIVDIKGTLIHEEAFIDWEDGADALEAIIEKLMQKNNGYISSTQLFEYARNEMNMFLNDNDMREERAVYDMAQHLFEKVHYHENVFAFRGKMHISRVDVGISSNLDIYKKYAADQGGVFSFNGLIEYLESIGVSTGNLRNQMRMWTEPIFFFYDYDVIATAEALRIDEDWKKVIKKSLDLLFDDAGDHMILRNIPSIWFERLPAISGNRPWTPLLLQSVLRFYNKGLGARTIQALDSQSLETLHAMIVAKDSPIQNFGDVVISYLLEQNIERRKFEAEELRLLLADGGILHGNELIWNMPKALKGDGRFAWDASGNQVIVKI